MGGWFWEFENYDRLRMDGKALALKAMEGPMMVYDATGVCKFTRGITQEEGVREGFTRENDMISERFTEPSPDGPSDGEFIAIDEYERELDRFYTARGGTRDVTPMTAPLSELDPPEIGEDVGTSNELVV